MNKHIIKISNIENLSSAEDAFNSRLVDIAYLYKSQDDYILAESDDEHLNLSISDNFEWIASIITQVLNEAGEKAIKLEVLVE